MNEKIDIIGVQSTFDSHPIFVPIGENVNAEELVSGLKKIAHKVYIGHKFEDEIVWRTYEKPKYNDLLWKYFTK
jgi:hypothetical protein